METSWLVRLLQDITTKVEIQRDGHGYDDYELDQVNSTNYLRHL